MKKQDLSIDKLDNIKKDSFLKFYEQDEVRGNVSLACEATGVHRQTYYYWLEHDKEFREKVKEAKLRLCDDMEGVLVNKAASGSTAELIFWLKNNHEGYREKPQTLVQVNNPTFTDEQLKRLLED